MHIIYDSCCGIDVHKKLMVACLIHDGRQEVREFGATSRELSGLCEWLASGRCQMAAMESTGSYWKPLYNFLEAYGLGAMVVNAQHMKNVPGRKTDVKDSEWIADLLQHGLLKASYIPDREQRELRELVGCRKSLVQDKTRELDRLQKMLEGANTKLSGTVSDINGKSARAILDVLVSGGTIDSAKYDEMVAEKKITGLKASKEQILDDVNGLVSPLQQDMMKVILAHIDELDVHIREPGVQIDGHLKPEEKKAVEDIKEVTGVGDPSSRIIISVIGTDTGRFPTDGHLSSWAGVCPGSNESAKKRKSGKTTKGNKLLRSTLITCAHCAVKNKNSFFYAQFTRIRAHRGVKRAYVAVAHSILTAIYHILKDGVKFKDLGAGYYNQFNKERKINSYLKKLKALGWDPGQAAAAQAV